MKIIVNEKFFGFGEKKPTFQDVLSKIGNFKYEYVREHDYGLIQPLRGNLHSLTFNQDNFFSKNISDLPKRLKFNGIQQVYIENGVLVDEVNSLSTNHTISLIRSHITSKLKLLKGAAIFFEKCEIYDIPKIKLLEKGYFRFVGCNFKLKKLFDIIDNISGDSIHIEIINHNFTNKEEQDLYSYATKHNVGLYMNIQN